MVESSVTANFGATPDRPWLGLAHFTAAEKDYFFGRETEIRELADRVRRTPLVVLYGVSGYGKSSLLGAGLIPALESSGFSVTLLRRCYESLSDRPLVPDVIAEVVALNSGARSGADGAGSTLWEFFHDLKQPWLQAPGAGDNAPPKPVLIFDQFEEVFTRGEDRLAPDGEADSRAREHARDFLGQLADLVENRPPAALRDLLESGTSEQRQEILSRYDFDARPVRCLLTLRDDFLAHLERWRRAMPSMMEHRVELQLLSGPQALEAVFKPGTKRSDHEPIIPREAAEAIVRTVARVPESTPLSEIQAVPSLLSLLCEQLNHTRLAEDSPANQIAFADVTDHSSDILKRFYQESFTPIPDSYREMVRAYVEDEMIAPESNRRHPVAREAAENHLKKNGVPDPAAVFDELIVRRLLTAEEQRGSSLLEITHDVLIPWIIDSRNERQEQWRKDEQERQLAAERQKVVAAARKARQRLWIVIAMAALMLAAALSAFFALRQRDESRYSLGLAWKFRAEVAEERGKQYPGTLLYAATAIGFDDAGRPEDGGTQPIRYITRERDPGRYEDAKKWLRDRPSYLPVWSSPTGGPGLDAMALSPTGRHLAVGGKDGQGLLWDLATGRSSSLPGGPALIFDLAFHPDGTDLAIASAAGLSLWPFHTGPPTGSPRETTTALAYSPDGRLLVTTRPGGELVLTLQDQQPVVLPGLGSAVSRIAFSAGNSVAAAAVPGKGVLVFFPWSSALSNTWTAARTPANGVAARAPSDATAVALSPDGSQLAIGNGQGSISLWDVAKAERQAEISHLQQHAGPVRDLCYHSSGAQLASSADDGEVKLWNTGAKNALLEITATLTGHTAPVTRIRYAPGDGLLASCSTDGSTRLWNVSRQLRSHPELYRYVAEGWYDIDLDLKPPAWKGNSGFIALPKGSLVGLWQQPSPASGVVASLSAARAWQAAVPAIGALPDRERETAAAGITTGLAKDAEEAAAASRWNLVDLRLSQWDRIGTPANETLAGLRLKRASFAKKDESFTNSENIALIWCPAGTFTMGSPESERDRQPEGEVQHKVTLTHGFWIGKYEITQSEWLSVIGSNPAEFSEEGFRQPIERIDWNQAMDFCRKLTDRERSRGVLPPGWEYTLPSEAQWEYACRAGNPGAYCSGDDRSRLYLYGNFKDASYGRKFPLVPGYPPDDSQDDGRDVTRTVGQYTPNDWGIHDMHGNVLEWCLDQFRVGAQNHVKPGQEAHLTDPLAVAKSDQEKDREARGGSYRQHPTECRSARGYSRSSTSSTPEIGMRVALVRVQPQK